MVLLSQLPATDSSSWRVADGMGDAGFRPERAGAVEGTDATDGTDAAGCPGAGAPGARATLRVDSARGGVACGARLQPASAATSA